MSVSEEPEGEVKPKINVVVEYDRQKTTIKVKVNTPFQKIFDAIDKKFKTQPGTLKYIFDGQSVQGTDTPAELGLEDGDVVEAHLHQVGGGA